MRLLLTLLCRNEADIVRSTVEFHLAQGVDFIIATDNNSTDTTAQILSSYVKKGCLRLLHEPEHTHDQATWVTRMAALAMEDYGADWIIHCDADEFWWPQSSSLKQELATVSDDIFALSINRYNFLPPPDLASRMDPFYKSQTLREKVSRNNLGYPLPPKICHRASADVWIGDGNHKVLIGGTQVAAPMWPGIEILHFPVRSLQQFERKIREGAAALARNPRLSPDVGRTWRTLHQTLLETGTLSDYYQDLYANAKDCGQGQSAENLVRDCRLRDCLTSVLG